MSDTPKVLFAAGGSGGHIFPALAVAKELRARRPDVEIAFVGSDKRMEARLIPEAGFRFIPVAAAGFPRGLSLRWVPALWTLARSLFQVIGIAWRERPNLVFATGGFVSGPITGVAALMGIPTIIHDSNAVPGLTNSWLGKIVREVHIAFEDAAPHFPANKVHLTGNPIRPEIVAAAQSGINAQPEREPQPPYTIFITGGSQGSRRINNAITGALPELATIPLRLIHQTGEGEYPTVRAAYGGFFSSHERVAAENEDALANPRNVTVTPFVDNMKAIYAQADLMICRSGAMTISEMTLFGIPAIMVPLPHAKTDEQRKNAQAVVAAGAGVMIEDANMTPENLVKTLNDLLGDPTRLAEMSANSRKVAKSNATTDLVDAVERYL
ncbi:MAG: undecaprenyldiphospho-muramoylpentapeptide beta-N-acetylglucosaminyltransferase [Candidatus Poribacteria bacterium]|nr:undecaprenyldiphospho-muramoylpentapeptide beta-N-acetylglucosaminyltransferase [Candidatus Poribacteria bacterium]